MAVMPSAETTALLAEAEPLPYPQRMALLAARARAWTGTPVLDIVLADLSADRQHRDTALFLAIVAGRRAPVRAALADPDPSVQCRALDAWIRSGIADAGELAEYLVDAPVRARRVAYRSLRRHRSPGVADALIDRVRDRFDDEEAGRLLPVCSSPTVARLLPEVGHALGSWSLLGARHPQVVLAEAARQLASLKPPGRAIWWARFGHGVLAAVPTVPEAVLDLLERYGPPANLPGGWQAYSRLARTHAGRVLALLTAPSRAAWVQRARLPRTLLRRLVAEGGDDLVLLARRVRLHEWPLAALLKGVPPAKRGTLYDATYADVDRSLAQPSDQILAVLPRARRLQEVRRVLGLADVRTTESMTVHYSAFLPWDQARDGLVAATRRPTPEERASGYEAMVTCACRSGEPGAVGETIEYLTRLRNEQDPVRGRALAVLASMAAPLLGPDTVPALQAITTDALQARDTAAATRQSLSDLATAVLRQHFAQPRLVRWALETLRALFGDRVPTLGRLDTRLRRGQETEVFAAVRHWLLAGIDRREYEPLFAVTQALGRRAWTLPDLQEMLAGAIGPGNVSPVVQRAVNFWLADPSTRSVRVEHVVRVDPSALALPVVWNHVCSRRTDLLDVALAGPPPRGKFLADGVTWVPLYAPHARRWLPRQRRDYAKLLARVAGDAGAKVWERTSAIAAAARLPDAGPPIVHRYLDSPNVNLAEAALGALAWTGEPDTALPLLLTHIRDDRARVAVYAAGRVAGFLRPSRLGEILSPVLETGKVTSRKETLRLAAQMSVPDAGHLLTEAWRRDGQHRDVRTAAVSAARQRLDDPASWRILEEAVDGDRPYALAALACTDPHTVAERYRLAYGRLVARACLDPDEQVTVAAMGILPRWAAWTPDMSTTLTTRISDLHDRLNWRAVVPALRGLLDAELTGTALPDIVEALAALDSQATEDEPDRDRPARQRLSQVEQAIAAWSTRAAPELDRTGIADAGRALARYPDFQPNAATLLLHALPLHERDPRPSIETLTEICRLVEDRPVAAGALAGIVGSRAADNIRTDAETARACAALLAERPGLAPGLLAVALLRSGYRLGWPAAWRDEILRLRRHNVADVRAAALAITLVQD
jgi:hypothetical protein